MKRLLLILAVMVAALPAWSRPRVTAPNPTRPYAVTVEFATGDTTDSEAIPVSGFCTVRYEQVSGDDASLYSVPTAETATGSGTLIAAFTSSTSSATTFTAGTRWVKAVATDATEGGSVMTIECAPQTASSTADGGVLAFESTCADPSAVDSYPCIDQNGVTWYRNAEALEVPYPVGPTHTRSMLVDTAGLLNASDATFGITDEWTCTAWIKLSAAPSAGSQNYVCYGRVVGNASGFFISMIGDSADGGSVNVRANVWDSAATEFKDINWEIQLDDADDALAWHMITVTYDGGATGDPLTLYLDGGEFPVQYHASSGYLNNTGTMDDAAGRSIRIAGNNGSANGLNGYIHSAALGSTALTAEQVAQLYNAGNSPHYLYFGFEHVYYPCLPGVIDTDGAEDRGNTDAVRDLNDAGTVACANINPGRPTVPIRGRTHVTGYGDSRMWVDLSENASEGFLPLIGKDFVTENRGVGGDRCDQVAEDIATDAASLTTDVVVIQCGVNDALPANYASGGGAAGVHAEVQGMVDDLVAQDIRVVVMTPFPVLDAYITDAERQPNTDEIAQYFRDHPFTGAEVCDTHQLWNTEVGDDSAKQAFYESDGIHIIHKEGDELIGGWLYDCLGTPLPF